MADVSAVGSSNVIPFVRPAQPPRPSPEVLCDLALQVGEIDELLVGEYADRPWWGVRDAVDAETARFIAEQLTHEGRVSEAALRGLLDPAVARAIDMCREALASWAELGRARTRAAAEGNAGIAWFAEQVEALRDQTIDLVEEALTLDQQARGIERAVGFARRGEAWVARDPHENIQWLLEAEEAAQQEKARRAQIAP